MKLFYFSGSPDTENGICCRLRTATIAIGAFNLVYGLFFFGLSIFWLVVTLSIPLSPPHPSSIGRNYELHPDNRIQHDMPTPTLNMSKLGNGEHKNELRHLRKPEVKQNPAFRQPMTDFSNDTVYLGKSNESFHNKTFQPSEKTPDTTIFAILIAIASIFTVFSFIYIIISILLICGAVYYKRRLLTPHLVLRVVGITVEIISIIYSIATLDFHLAMIPPVLDLALQIYFMGVIWRCYRYFKYLETSSLGIPLVNGRNMDPSLSEPLGA